MSDATRVAGFVRPLDEGEAEPARPCRTCGVCCVHVGTDVDGQPEWRHLPRAGEEPCAAPNPYEGPATESTLAGAHIGKFVAEALRKASEKDPT
jgi:hypothetical protein